ncbi:HAMP domain-containing histidine kinase [Paenibacillus sp. P96]|uniref:histidine kinase n=1 Tax=Paenibacillus zeirhizosphaerae TaxID=2987519 RepID=A0ABT9FM14_9BACL|nr:HAMP domain-containing sensor histidine kinase [Paenibacillus sp. P96]MDP4095798.1 HAMP domain-containing histidine kinase [Paenibacillus sp. P96]
MRRRVWRFGLKWKAAVLLALLLAAVIAMLSFLVLAGIRDDQRVRLEQTLAGEAEAANLTVRQEALTSGSLPPDDIMERSGQRLAVDLGAQSGLPVTLYKPDGTLAGTSLPFQPKADVKDALTHTAQGQSAYITESDRLLYLAPLYNDADKQVGTIQFHVSLAEQHAFYERIQRLFWITGVLVLTAGFLFGFLYVWRQAHVIGRLNQAARRIGDGEYLSAPTVRRADELGELAQGIYEMSGRISSTLTQLTEEKSKLLEAVARLKELEQQQKQFIGNISHELKTPLTSILAYADLLDMYRDDPALLDEAGKQIGQEAERLYGLVEKALKLSSMDVYEFETHAKSVSLMPLLHEAAARLQAKAERHGIEIDTTLEEGTVWADPDNLMHMVLNLLDNGIKYNKPGGKVLLSNEAMREREGQGWMKITVRDTGIGIPEEARAKIFDPFYTVSSDRSRAHGGTGLGLPLVKGLAEKQGGTVGLTASGPEGSVFVITLPLRQPERLETISVGNSPDLE